MHRTPAHVTISWVFLILIGIAFGYSYFFYPNSHPIPCMIKEYTGKDCATCGFSRSFSNFVHFQFAEGKSYNTLAFPVFLFFVLQFFLRLAIVIHYRTTKKELGPLIIKSDVIISISGFLLAFLPILFKT
ncbi:MAG: hypothetical protein K0S32_1672 [Bacteroidetes bacterium]|jgi:hypothetical protein|nr:hypothetical protein [Bacteroidota bacterium]